MTKYYVDKIRTNLHCQNNICSNMDQPTQARHTDDDQRISMLHKA